MRSASLTAEEYRWKLIRQYLIRARPKPIPKKKPRTTLGGAGLPVPREVGPGAGD